MAVQGPGLEERHPPSIKVQADYEQIARYRAAHKRPLYCGRDDQQQQGLTRCRDAYVLGPYHASKELAAQDGKRLEESYGHAKLVGLLQAKQAAFQSAEKPQLAHGMLGSEIEVEIDSDGLKKARAVSYFENSAEEHIRVEGPWKKSRQMSEKDAEALESAAEGGLAAVQQRAAEVSAKTPALQLPFSESPYVKSLLARYPVPPATTTRHDARGQKHEQESA